MSEPPVEWLQRAAEHKLEVTGVNVWKALRHRAFVQVLDFHGDVIEHVKRLDLCKDFRVTARGHALLEFSKKTSLPFKKGELPKNIELWLSGVRRLMRNIPKDLVLTEKDEELHVLVKDNEGNVACDGPHRLATIKVPWHVIKE
jgi:hypothetical protein